MTRFGRPLKFEKPDDLLKVVEHYFDNTPFDEWSVTGLAIAVGSRQLLIDYAEREEYGWIVDRAKLFIENSYELSLRKNGRAGDIFALKNFGWFDRTQTELSGSDDSPVRFTLALGDKAVNKDED